MIFWGWTGGPSEAMQGSASAPVLPPVPASVRAAQQRGLREAAKRKEFLGGLINQDRRGGWWYHVVPLVVHVEYWCW